MIPSVHPFPAPRFFDTPLGPATCFEMIVWDQENFIWYSCWIDETGENWFWDNTNVRLARNITCGHTQQTPFKYDAALTVAYRRHKHSPFHNQATDSTGAGCSR